MDSLDLIQTFREVARRNSFSAAARALDMSPANVSKYVAQLETRFGVRLFHRTTRKVSLTDAGQLLYERSGPVLELVQMTASELQERATRPSGRLTVTAPHAQGVAGLVVVLLLGVDDGDLRLRQQRTQPAGHGNAAQAAAGDHDVRLAVAGLRLRSRGSLQGADGDGRSAHGAQHVAAGWRARGPAVGAFGHGVSLVVG